MARMAAAHGYSATTLAQAESMRALQDAIASGGRTAPRLTSARIRWEALERTLSTRSLILAPSTVSIWLGDTVQPTVAAPR